jgi:hypothetical protein
MGENLMTLKPWRSNLILLAAIASIAAHAFVPSAQGAITWDGQGGSNWWFNPVNWHIDGSPNNVLPPNPTIASGDAQINIGTSGAWNVTGEGVVYDPANDPFYAAAFSLTYPTGSPTATMPGIMRDYGPETIYRLYVSRLTTNTNVLTIKSGDLVVENTTIIGRSGSTASQQNQGIVVQTGGQVRFPTTAVDIGQREPPTVDNPQRWGNGVWDYRGGILEVQQVSGTGGIRLSHGSNGNGAGGQGRFIMHNPATPGRVRTFDFTVASFGGPTGGNAALDPDGVTTGVGIVEFHYENGGTRPIQVDRNLSINNGLDADLFGTRSSRLEFVVNQAACVGAGCVPNNVGLFDVDFNSVFGGTITGTGDLTGDAVFNNDRVFSNAAGTSHYREGDIVSGTFGGVRYDWKISYSGNITWDNADAGDVGTVTGNGTGVDVVLIGFGSVSVGIPGDFDNDSDVDGRDFLIWQRNTSVGNLSDWQTNYGTGTGPLTAVTAVPEPGSLALLAAAVLPLLGRRRR